MTGERRMCEVNSCVEHHDLDRAVRTGTAVYLMRRRKMKQLRRPLRRVSTRIANTPTIADAPAVAATFGRFLDKVWFSKNDAYIGSERADTSCNCSSVGDAQAINWSRAKLVKWCWVERILRRNRREIGRRGQLDDYFARDQLITIVTRANDDASAPAPEQ